MSDPIHATCVALGGRGVLLTGPSGSGKSDLALRLLDRGARLVSDDYTVIERRGDRLVATAPATIAGRIEVRGIGIVDWPAIAEVDLCLVVTLGAGAERMPEPASCDIAGVGLPLLRLDAFPASAAIKVELAVARLVEAAR